MVTTWYHDSQKKNNSAQMLAPSFTSVVMPESAKVSRARPFRDDKPVVLDSIVPVATVALETTSD